MSALRPRPGVEDYGAGLGYTEGAAGQRAVAGVQLFVGQAQTGRVTEGLDAVWDPALRQERWYDEPLHATVAQGLLYDARQLVLSYAADGGLVLGDPLGEAPDDLLAFGLVPVTVAALDRHVPGALVLGDVAGCAPHAPEDRLLRGCH